MQRVKDEIHEDGKKIHQDIEADEKLIFAKPKIDKKTEENEKISKVHQMDKSFNNVYQPHQQPKSIEVGKNLLFVKPYSGMMPEEKETSFIEEPITKLQNIPHQVVQGPQKSNDETILQKENTWNIVKEFCCTSTIDALQYTVGKKWKRLWTTLFILVAIYCFYQCKFNIGTYLECSLSTKITDKSDEISDFPAITMCPMRMHKKSTYGNVMKVEFGLTGYYANSFEELISLIGENRKSCNNHNNLTEEMKQFEVDKYDSQLRDGSIWMSNEFTITYQDVLMKCTWDRNSMDCSDAFLNHVTDVGQCFTFNPGDGIAQFTNSTRTGYGLNLTKYSEKHFTSGPGKRGLKLIFNIKQSEYCGNEQTKRGAGLFFQIHGTNRNPSFVINPSTYISPGYDTNVVIEKKVYDRKTEHLGHCKSFLPLYMTPDVSFYVLEHCYMLCVSEQILRACACYPPNLGGFEPIFLSNVASLGVPKESIRACLQLDYVCLKQWIHFNMSKTPFDVLCPYCKQPCSETKYSIQMTSLLLSQRNLLDISHVSNASVSELRKNFLMVTFVLKAPGVQLIVEKQAFDLHDLFIYLGNNIGLYLGMSFTTMFELVYFFIRLFVFYWKRAQCKLYHFRKK